MDTFELSEEQYARYFKKWVESLPAQRLASLIAYWSEFDSLPKVLTELSHQLVILADTSPDWFTLLNGHSSDKPVLDTLNQLQQYWLTFMPGSIIQEMPTVDASLSCLLQFTDRRRYKVAIESLANTPVFNDTSLLLVCWFLILVDKQELCFEDVVNQLTPDFSFDHMLSFAMQSDKLQNTLDTHQIPIEEYFSNVKVLANLNQMALDVINSLSVCEIRLFIMRAISVDKYFELLSTLFSMIYNQKHELFTFLQQLVPPEVIDTYLSEMIGEYQLYLEQLSIDIKENRPYQSITSFSDTFECIEQLVHRFILNIFDYADIEPTIGDIDQKILKDCYCQLIINFQLISPEWFPYIFENRIS